MNINALTERSYVGVPQLSSKVEWLLSRWQWLPHVLFPLVLLGYALLLRRVVERGLQKQTYPLLAWLVGLLVPVLLFWKHYQYSVVMQLLLLAVLAYQELTIVVLPLLIHQQANYAVLLVLCLYRCRGHLPTFALIVVKIISVWSVLHGLEYYLGLAGPWKSATQYLNCTINRQATPSVYVPNFSLWWVLHSHFFDRYRSLYETAALAIPITAIYPLSRIVQRLSKTANLEAPLTVVCLFVWLFITQMIYYFGHWTSAADGFFYFLMLLPASNYLAKNVPATLPFVLASLLFYFLSLAVSWEWANNFTVSTSYLFYMLMPFWVLTAVLVVEIGGTLAELTNSFQKVDTLNPPTRLD